MKMSEEIGQLAGALAKAQGAIQDATKNAQNPFFKSKYADLSSVRSTIKDPLSENELALTQFPTVGQNGVSVETMLLHSSGQFMVASTWVPIAKADAHGIGSALTYARRYGIMSLLCLATEDDDGNAAVEPDKAKFATNHFVAESAPKKGEKSKAPAKPKPDTEFDAAVPIGAAIGKVGEKSKSAYNFLFNPEEYAAQKLATVADKSIDDIIAEGFSRAALGSIPLRSWWSILPQNVRVSIDSNVIADMKRAGVLADEEKQEG